MWARYAQIPLCNLAGGAQLLDTITNIQLGRLLHSADQITWWDDFNSELTTTYESAAFTGKIMNPGIYSNYCVEVAMENLAVNTIAIAEDLGLEDRETAGLVMKGNANANKWESLDEMSLVKKPFEYIRKIVKLWIKEFEETESFWAHELLRNFHRWITTPSGALYDPLLTRLVNELMKKVFHLLAHRL
jgi:DNA polymerase epsilon subunit 1